MNRVLIIDDFEGVHNAFRIALEGSPVELLGARDGLRGIATVEQHDVDLVFLDLKMHGMDGVETLRRIRKVRPVLPVIIMTGFAEDYLDALRAESDGLNFELIRKPLDMNEIYLVTGIALGGFSPREEVRV